MKRFGLALLATALAVLCVILFLLDGKKSALPKGMTTAGSAQSTSQAAPELAVQPPSDASAQVTLDEPLEERSQVETGTGAALPQILGAIDLSALCAPDPELEVFLLKAPCNESRLVRRLASAEPWSDLLGRTLVGPDGTFALGRPAEHEDLHVMLRGRLHAQAQSTAVPDDPTQTIVLVPEVRSSIKVALRAADTGNLAETKIQCISARPGQNPQAMGAGDWGSQETYSDASGQAFVGGLTREGDYEIVVMPREYAAQRVPVTGMQACEQRVVAVELRHGAAVSGSVRDESGQGVAEAKVSAAWGGKWFGFDDLELRETKSAADGSFQLTDLPAGEISLRCTLDGWLGSKKIAVDVPHEGQLSDVTLTLELGNSLAGMVTWEDGTPATGLTVKIDLDLAASGGMGFMGLQRGGSARVQTDDAGRFHATGLNKGPFRVECESGEASAEVGAEAWPELGQPKGADAKTSGPPRRARLSDVAAGRTDLLLVLTAPPGLFGRVLDPQGNPLPEFEVLLQAGGGALAAMMGEKHKEKFKDDLGHFFLGNLNNGAWQVSVRAEGFASAQPLPLQLPSTTAEDRLEIRLVATATVEGIVLSPDGVPIADASVAESRGGEGMQAMWDNIAKSQEAVQCDATGHFRLSNLLPGSVRLRAESPNWARGPAYALELIGGEIIKDVELRLLEGGTLTGEIYDNEGEPAPNRMITAQLLSDFSQKITTSDAAGLFRIERLPPGEWQVSAISMENEWMNEDGLDAAKMLQDMELTQAHIEDGVQTHIILGGKVAGAVRVHGKVTHIGEPYRGAMITFQPSGDRPIQSMEFTTVDETGSYEIELDGPGFYSASVAKLSGEMGSQSSVEFPCEIPAGSDYRLDFQIPHGRISGRVFAPDGAPHAGARITVVSDGIARSDSLFGGHYTEIRTDSEGRYDVQGLRAGVFRVTAGGGDMLGFGGEATSGRMTRGGLALAEEQWLQNIDFHLESPGTLEVQVTDADGAPAGGATIFVRDAEGRVLDVMSFHQTDSAGLCRYAGLHPGRYTVLARGGSQASAESAPLEIHEGKLTRLELQLAEGAVLWVRFKLDEGDEVPARVQVTDAAGRDVTALLGMADIQKLYREGGFSPTEHRIGPLAPGKYKIQAWSSDGQTGKKNVVVQAGESEQRFTLRLGAE